MNSSNCEHVLSHKKSYGTGPYEVFHTVFVSCLAKGSRNEKVDSCYCYECKTKINRIFGCLTCIYFGCFENCHIHAHATSKQHPLAICATYGNLYCFICKDFKFDPDLDKISRRVTEVAARNIGIVPDLPWEPSEEDQEILKENFFAKKPVEKSYRGLRGLVNLDQTCFMNCIVQVLTHTPTLRDYFLSDLHSCTPEESLVCLACETARLFQAWKNDANLAGYQQQDAHEFFSSYLDILHLHSRELDLATNKCSCIVDKIFTGSTQSDVVCKKCNNVSSKIETFWHMSLEMPTEGISDPDSISLADCLFKFTTPEDISIKCDNCHFNEPNGFTKQLTIKKLPIVVSFQLKRYTNDTFKNTAHITFPEVIDMAQFSSSVRGQSEVDKASPSTPFTKKQHIYVLFAVVNHIGKPDSGHYISWIRHHTNHWFMCNDECIKRASLHTVLQSEAYLLFYHKHVLEYDP